MKSLKGILATIIYMIGTYILGYIIRCIGESICNSEPKIFDWVLLLLGLVFIKLLYKITFFVSFVLYHYMSMRLLYQTKNVWRWVALLFGINVALYNIREFWIRDINEYTIWSIVVGLFLTILYCSRLYISYLSFRFYMDLLKK